VLTAILANMGTLIFFVYYEFNMTKHKHKRDPIKWPNAMDDPYNQEPYTNLVRMLVMVLTLFALISLVQRHRYKVEW